jgi:dethiobiotin synthetase
MATGYFITGTDTSCGKTEITLGLMHLLQAQGKSVVGMKPVASGATVTEDGLRNDDAQRILHHSSQSVPYELVNPCVFEPPIAPHLAAGKLEQKIGFELILGCYERLSSLADMVIVEGVGGWRVPLGEDGDLSDLAQAMKLPVILVVGMKLGCLNHALLSVDAIRAKGLVLAGWVANIMDPEVLELEANLETLRQTIGAPCLGVVPYMRTVSTEIIAASIRLG